MVKKMPEVSVVMAVYNEEGKVHLGIESILNQTLTDFEFIIIDDGSTDRTPEVLASYSDKEPRMKVIRQDNQGLTRALNHGLALATGRYIARQDDNDISLPERLARQVAYLEKKPAAVLVGCDIDLIDDEDRFLVTIKNSQLKDIVKKLRKMNPFCHGSILFRRAVGGIDIRYNEFYQKAQDYDLVCRVAETGEATILPEMLYRWRFSRRGILATNVTFYGDRARENYIRRLSGLAEDFSPPAPEQVTPDYSGWRMTWSLAIRYLSGYETGKARSCFFAILNDLPFMGREYRQCLKYIAISLLPHSLLRKIREG
jgi:glycosyltransferase involved in cell wall biosynthesis